MEPISRRGLLCHADHKSDDNPDDRRSLTFENLPAAERFKTLLDDHGPDEALRIIELDRSPRPHRHRVADHPHRQPDRRPAGHHRATAPTSPRDVDPVFGSMPVSAVT